MLSVRDVTGVDFSSLTDLFEVPRGPRLQNAKVLKMFPVTSRGLLSDTERCLGTWYLTLQVRGPEVFLS